MSDQEIGRKLKLRADQSEQQLKELWKELDELTKLFGEKQSAALANRLRSQNECLRQEIEKKITELTTLEKQHKVPQILNTSTSSPVKSKQTIPNGVAPAAPAAEEPPKAEKPKEKSKKKPEKQAKPADAAPPAAVDVSRLDFRVGRIIKAEKHPDADSLYVEDVDVGEGKTRTVVSGLVKSVPLDQMQNRMAVLLCNLKPAKMRGVTSEAMVMCAVTPEKTEILSPPTGAVPGDLVEFEGYQRNPDAVLSAKQKVFETVQPDLKVEKGIATYKGISWTVPGKGVVAAPSLQAAIIR